MTRQDGLDAYIVLIKQNLHYDTQHLDLQKIKLQARDPKLKLKMFFFLITTTTINCILL